MTEAMPFLQKYDITFLRPPAITAGAFLWWAIQGPNTHGLFITSLSLGRPFKSCMAFL